jgi:hypothetical protein
MNIEERCKRNNTSTLTRKTAKALKQHRAATAGRVRTGPTGYSAKMMGAAIIPRFNVLGEIVYWERES